MFINNRDRYLVSASEIGEYVFCPHCWWLNLRERHYSNDRQRRLNRGSQGHQDFYNHIHGARSKFNLAIFIIFTALLFLALVWVISQMIKI